MRAAAKQGTLSVSVSQSLPVCISVLRLAHLSSGQESTPTVFGFDLEAALKGLGRDAVARWHGSW
jgi:hypothetical protein